MGEYEVGRPVPRLEDEALPTGRGLFGGDDDGAPPYYPLADGRVRHVGAPPAVTSVVGDALSVLGIDDFAMPATAGRVWRAIKGARDAPP